MWRWFEFLDQRPHFLEFFLNIKEIELGNEKLGCLVKLSALVLIVISSLLNGWALKVLWSWFVAPVFQVSSISTAQAIGLSLVFVLMQSSSRTSNNTNSDKSPTALLFEAVFLAVVTPLFAVGCGWVISQFV